MKRIPLIAAAIFALAISAIVFVAVASAAPPQTAPGKNPLTCFGTTAACTSNGKTATINSNNGGAGVYLAGYNNSFYGVRTNLIKTLSNNVSGSPLGIDPHWSIPIDDSTLDTGGIHDGNTNYFVFASFADCNNGAGLVDVINDTTCTISAPNNVSYPNWTAFVTANPNTYIEGPLGRAFRHG